MYTYCAKCTSLRFQIQEWQKASHCQSIYYVKTLNALKKSQGLYCLCFIVFDLFWRCNMFSTIKSNDCGSKSQECRPNL